MQGTFVAPPSFVGDRRTRITVVGVGGTGSHFVAGLARLQVSLMALGHPGFEVRLVDGDTVSPSNVGRQCYYAGDVGLSKALCMQHRINMAFGFDWTATFGYLKPAELTDRRRPMDLLVTCTDKAALRAEVGQRLRKHETPTAWLDYGNGPSSGQVVLGHLGVPPGGERIPNVFDLFPELSDMTHLDREEPSCSMEEAMTRQEFPINVTLANLGIAMLWTLIRKGCLNHHGYMLSTDPAVTTSPMPVDANAWAFYGYVAPEARTKARSRRKTTAAA
jgi:PRTRC genetic system ThiF family protein